mgnify:CR=1 FL=1
MRWLCAIAAVPGLALSGPALAQPSSDHGWGWHMGWGWGGMILGTLTLLVVLGGLVVLAVLLARWLGAGSGREGPAGRPTPLEILQERFAKGEIDKQEFEDRRRALRGEA